MGTLKNITVGKKIQEPFSVSTGVGNHFKSFVTVC